MHGQGAHTINQPQFQVGYVEVMGVYLAFYGNRNRSPIDWTSLLQSHQSDSLSCCCWAVLSVKQKGRTLDLI